MASRINWSAYPGDPPEPPDPPQESLDVYELLEAEGVKQEVIDKVCEIVETLAGQANRECPQCEARWAEEERNRYEEEKANPDAAINKQLEAAGGQEPPNF